MKERIFYNADGEKIIVPLIHPRLKKDAVPTIFPGLPSYFSKENASREDPMEKKIRIENEHLREAIEASIKSQEEEDKKFKFESYNDFVRCLSKNKLPNS